MNTDVIRTSIAAVAIVVLTAGRSDAQSVQWGAKAGITSSSVSEVADYYDWVLCCHPLFPHARVDSQAGINGTAGVFVAAPIAGWFGVQGELLYSRRQHAVDLQPYENVTLSFRRDYVDAVALARATIPTGGFSRFYAAAGPVLGFKVGEDAKSSDPSLRVGNPATNICAVQFLAYGAPDLLRPTQMSVAAVAGWTFRRLLVEVRLTQGLT